MTTRELNALYTRLGINPPPSVAAPDASKYNATKKMADGILFDSSGEAECYRILKLQEKSGAISGLELQPRFVLAEAFRDATGKTRRRIEYRADFRFTRGGRTVIADYKGFPTPVYKLKLKLFLQKYPHLDFEEWNHHTLRQWRA